MAHFLTPLLDATTPVGLQVERTGEWLVRQIEGAFDSTSRRQGLLGRDGLADSTGLVIAPSQGVHTFGMRFPLDIVCVAKDGTVVKVRETVQPGRIVIAWRAFAILELPAGMARRASLAQGDRLIARACAAGVRVGDRSRPASRRDAVETVAPGADRSQNAR